MLQQYRQPGNDTVIHEPPLCPPGACGGSPLPERLLRALEHLSGHDLGGVRVYRDSALPARLGARAFAYGEDIHLSPGAEDALAHEAWHVVQQREGRVRATGRLGDVTLNDDPWLEREAEVMGRRAERLSASPRPGGIRRVPILSGPVTHPVVQRVVTLRDESFQNSQALREELSEWYGINAGNTPHLQVIVDDLVRNNRTFRTFAELQAELKRRSFGLRHLAAMEALRVRQEEAITTYMQNQGVTRDQLKVIADKFRASASSEHTLAKTRAKYADLTFLHWGPAVFINPDSRTPLVTRSPFFKWMVNQPGPTPYQMNCWEAVLYAGGWTDGGTRRALYSTDYAFWADQLRLSPSATFKPPPDAKKPDKSEPALLKVPRFVPDIINNPVEHQTKQGQPNNLPRSPATIHPGMIVIFNCGNHVALATGRTRALLTNEGRDRYGAHAVGHEILEMDGATDLLIQSTLEDAIGRGYTNEVHLGWLPECPRAQTLRYGNVTVQVAQTSFYA